MSQVNEIFAAVSMLCPMRNLIKSHSIRTDLHEFGCVDDVLVVLNDGVLVISAGDDLQANELLKGFEQFSESISAVMRPANGEKVKNQSSFRMSMIIKLLSA